MGKGVFPSLVLTVAATYLLVASSAVQARENVFEALPAGVDAYVYGYPLVTMEMTRRVMTNVEKPVGTRAPMGQFVRAREYPSAAFRDVTAPNADTLYTTAWVDVGREPWVLSLPDAKGRYYLFPMLDGWTDVFQVPGKRTTGTGPQTYAITGPGWKGKLPAGVKEYKSPTAMVWLLGRIYCTGTPEDYAAVHKMQDEISLVPLSAYGKTFTPPPGTVDPSIDMKTAVRDQVNALSADEYFSLLARLMKDNPPNPAEARIVKKMADLGIVAGKPFDRSKLDPVGVHDQDRPLRHELYPACPRHGHRSWRQSSAGCGLSHFGGPVPSRLVFRRKEVRDALSKREAPARRGLLVPHDVRQRLLLRRESAQPLQHQRQAGPQGQPRWFRGSAHPERKPRCG